MVTVEDPAGGRPKCMPVTVHLRSEHPLVGRYRRQVAQAATKAFTELLRAIQFRGTNTMELLSMASSDAHIMISSA